MGSSLKFEFKTRWQDLAARLLGLAAAGAPLTPDQQRAVEILNNRDQALEDFLNRLGSGGTAQSVIATSSATGDFGNSGTNFHVIECEFDVPSDTAFDYWVDYTVKGYIIQPLEAGTRANLYGYGEIVEQPPGSGFDTLWGYGNSVATSVDWVSLGGGNEHGNPHLSGASRRIEKVDPGLLGTTITVKHTIVYSTTSSTYATSQYIKAATSALLIAIPAGLVIL